MPSSRVPAWPECAALPAGFASGADLGREGDVAALRDALAELSRARERRARRRSRAGWTRPTCARGRENARRGRRSSRRTRPHLRRRPRAETRPARRLPPTTRISRRMARSGATTLRRAPLPVPPRPRTRARARNPPRCARSLPPGIPRRRRRGRRRRRRHPGRGSRSVRRRDEGRNVEVHLCRVQTTATRVRERALRGSPRDSIGERASTRGATLLLPRATLPSLDASLDARRAPTADSHPRNPAARIPSTNPTSSPPRNASPRNRHFRRRRKWTRTSTRARRHPRRPSRDRL